MAANAIVMNNESHIHAPGPQHQNYREQPSTEVVKRLRLLPICSFNLAFRFVKMEAQFTANNVRSDATMP